MCCVCTEWKLWCCFTQTNAAVWQPVGMLDLSIVTAFSAMCLMCLVPAQHRVCFFAVIAMLGAVWFSILSQVCCVLCARLPVCISSGTLWGWRAPCEGLPFFEAVFLEGERLLWRVEVPQGRWSVNVVWRTSWFIYGNLYFYWLPAFSPIRLVCENWISLVSVGLCVWRGGFFTRVVL